MVSTSNIANFYRDRSVFITGGTGFLGKVLVEKLLRSCPDIKAIYLLIRPKKGQDIRGRLTQEFHSHIVFDKLIREQPEVMSKIIPVGGDISFPNLGISGPDLQRLFDNVSIVFNSAATIRFNEELRTAVQLNVKGPQQLLYICRQMKHLDALVHVSTAFNNLDKDIIEEIVYPTSITPKKLLKIVDILDDECLRKLTDGLVGTCPNTYTFTKTITDQLLKEEHGDIPLVIVRPSIVTAAVKEPLPGWTDNINGPTGIIAGGSKGFLRVARTSPDLVGDIIPVDFSINLMIVLAWYTATYKPKEVKVFTFSTGQHNPIKWGQFRDYVSDLRMTLAVSGMLWYPNVMYITSKTAYHVATFLYHYIPAYIIDFLTFIVGKKTKLVRLYRKVDEFVLFTSFFTIRQWRIVSNNFIHLLDRLSDEDRRIFYFDVREIDWKAYIEDYALGVRRYILKDNDETIPAARISMNRLYWLQKATHALIWVVFGFILFQFYK